MSQTSREADRLKVGDLIRIEAGKFGVVVSIANSTARLKTDGKTRLMSVSECRRNRIRNRTCKVFRGDDNISAELFRETDAGSFRLTAVHPAFHYAHRFWWGKGDGEGYDLRRLQTAAIILFQVAGDRQIAETFAERFANEVVKTAAPNRFYLTELEIREWLEMASAELAAEGAVNALGS